MWEKLLNFLTGGTTGITGAVTGVAQTVAIGGMIGTAWLWTWTHKDEIFVTISVSQLVVFGTVFFPLIYAVVAMAARGVPDSNSTTPKK